MRSTWLKLAAAAPLALTGAAFGQGAFYDVFVYDFDFSINRPGEGPVEDVVLPVGNRVRWIWLDDFHNTVACVGQPIFWESEIEFAGATFEVFFDTPGVYVYYCSPHGRDNGDGTAFGMQGTITVLPIPGPGGAGAMAVLAGAAACLRRRR